MARAKKSEGKVIESKVTPVSASVEKSAPEEPDLAPPVGGYPPVEADFPFHGIPMPDAPRTAFAREIAEAIEKRGITREAAQLLAAGQELNEIEATRIALRLLEAQQYALAALREEENFESGLEKCRQAWQARESVEAAFASVIPYEFETDQHGKPLPVPLDKGLGVLMPDLKKDPKARLERFLQWLSDTPVWQLRMEIEALEKRAHDESLENRKRVEAFGLLLAKQLELSQLSKDPQEFRAQAEKKLGEWRGDGIPADVFEFALRGFKHWWYTRVKEMRSVYGKEGRQKQLASEAQGDP